MKDVLILLYVYFVPLSMLRWYLSKKFTLKRMIKLTISSSHLTELTEVGVLHGLSGSQSLLVVVS